MKLITVIITIGSFLINYPTNAQINCESTCCFTTNESNDWKLDSIGTLGIRLELYLKYFFKKKDMKNKDTFDTMPKRCILDVFGLPNKIYVNRKEEKYLYYVRWENYTRGTLFEGLTLEITFHCDKVIHFNFYIT